MNETIVFKKLPELLTTAFVLSVDGVSHGEPMRKMLVRQLESLPLSSDLSDWLDQLRANTLALDGDEDAQSGFFDRASPDVSRSWSAEVLAGLVLALPGLQWALLVARYSPLVAGANVKLVFPRAKVDAVTLIAKAVIDAEIVANDLLSHALVSRLFAPHDRGVSFRSLAGSFQMSKSTIERISSSISRWLEPHEAAAIAAATAYLRNNNYLTA